MNTVLLCTVGGSHQPILRAIQSVRPEHVVFFCTERNANTGMRGSDVQIVGNGNIPAQAGLNECCFELRVVPADDMDGAVTEMRAAVMKLRETHAEHRVLADYTGGTKSMAAALVLVALEFDHVELQLIAGVRDGTTTVDGTEMAIAASVAALRLRTAMMHCLDGWRRFAYHEAAEGLETLRFETMGVSSKHDDINNAA